MTILFSILSIIIFQLVQYIRLNKKYKLSSVIYKPKYFDFPLQHQDNPQGLKSPQDLGLYYQDVSVLTEDGVNLHGWYLPNRHRSHFPTIIYFQEEYGSKYQLIIFIIDLGTKLYFLQYYLKIVQANIFVFSYRGFGLSGGYPSKSGLIMDSRAIIKYVIDNNEGKGLYIHGRQLGANLTLEISTEFQNKIDGIILDNIVVQSLDLVKKYINIKYDENWDVDNIIEKPNVKTLFIICIRQFISIIQAEKNETSSGESQNLIYESMKSVLQKEKYLINQSTMDNNWCLKPTDYFERISQFMSTQKQM